MNKIIGIFLMIITAFILGSGQFSFGQTSGTPINTNTSTRDSDNMVNQSLADLRNVEMEARKDAIIKPKPYSAKLRQENFDLLEKNLLLEDLPKIKPAEKYFIQYADFLKNKNTGLARLHPNQKCDQGLTVNIKEIERCATTLKIRGNGSFYSFRNRTNINTPSGSYSDIQFIDGKFVVGNLTQFGLIRELGENLDLDDLNLKSKEFEFLLQYKPKYNFQEVKLEKERLEKGMLDKFSSSANFKLNSTYILRSVAYELSFINLLDDRADIIVAFKVIAQENDGSVILLWKQLKTKSAKKLKGEITK